MPCEGKRWWCGVRRGAEEESNRKCLIACGANGRGSEVVCIACVVYWKACRPAPCIVRAPAWRRWRAVWACFVPYRRRRGRKLGHSVLDCTWKGGDAGAWDGSGGRGGGIIDTGGAVKLRVRRKRGGEARRRI